MEKSSFMKQALALAKAAGERGEVPVGAVVVHNGMIIGRGSNKRENEKNAVAHAEIEAISQACETIGSWRLHECEMYVTLEPCPMCSGAIINSRIRRVIFGAYDEKGGACVSLMNMFDYPFNHKPQIIGGYMEEECRKVLTEFFDGLR
ncbi:MAG: tRNA adenosine(34) deaminase TadA [Faecalibacterium sp.]|nr:tRNA adenosine(34) deaminase TadA [Ruminococcus sp.]MCM1391473.1 tRNA adenosine(34) deaminase TadA [Ruminococcus sp.]MCM1485269.1 tRNA adenosine(34) deaminase TadA [Faecalibacterium sp.]